MSYESSSLHHRAADDHHHPLTAPDHDVLPVNHNQMDPSSSQEEQEGVLDNELIFAPTGDIAVIRQPSSPPASASPSLQLQQPSWQLPAGFDASVQMAVMERIQAAAAAAAAASSASSQPNHSSPFSSFFNYSPFPSNQTRSVQFDDAAAPSHHQAQAQLYSPSFTSTGDGNRGNVPLGQAVHNREYSLLSLLRRRESAATTAGASRSAYLSSSLSPSSAALAGETRCGHVSTPPMTSGDEGNSHRVPSNAAPFVMRRDRQRERPSVIHMSPTASAAATETSRRRALYLSATHSPRRMLYGHLPEHQQQPRMSPAPAVVVAGTSGNDMAAGGSVHPQQTWAAADLAELHQHHEAFIREGPLRSRLAIEEYLRGLYAGHANEQPRAPRFFSRDTVDYLSSAGGAPPDGNNHSVASAAGDFAVAQSQYQLQDHPLLRRIQSSASTARFSVDGLLDWPSDTTTAHGPLSSFSQMQGFYSSRSSPRSSSSASPTVNTNSAPVAPQLAEFIVDAVGMDVLNDEDLAAGRPYQGTPPSAVPAVSDTPPAAFSLASSQSAQQQMQTQAVRESLHPYRVYGLMPEHARHIRLQRLSATTDQARSRPTPPAEDYNNNYGASQGQGPDVFQQQPRFSDSERNADVGSDDLLPRLAYRSARSARRQSGAPYEVSMYGRSRTNPMLSDTDYAVGGDDSSSSSPIRGVANLPPRIMTDMPQPSARHTSAASPSSPEIERHERFPIRQRIHYHPNQGFRPPPTSQDEVTVGNDRIPLERAMSTRFAHALGHGPAVYGTSQQQNLRHLQDVNAEQRRRLIYIPQGQPPGAGLSAASIFQFMDGASAIFMHADGEPKLILEEDVIAAIATDTESFTFSNQFAQTDECIICFDEYAMGQDVRVLSCSQTHRFHKECIDKWLIKNKPNCPICRRILPSLKLPRDYHSAGGSSQVHAVATPSQPHSSASPLSP